jgi:hypothetical protein
MNLNIEERTVSIRVVKVGPRTMTTRLLNQLPHIRTVYTDERCLEFVGPIWGYFKIGKEAWYLVEINGKFYRCVSDFNHVGVSTVNQARTNALMESVGQLFLV